MFYALNKIYIKTSYFISYVKKLTCKTKQHITMTS